MELRGQLPLFDPPEQPSWDDVQKGRARAVAHGRYSQPCRPSCMWSDDISGGTCYLFREPVMGGMCPSSTHLEWA